MPGYFSCYSITFKFLLLSFFIHIFLGWRILAKRTTLICSIQEEWSRQTEVDRDSCETAEKFGEWYVPTHIAFTSFALSDTKSVTQHWSLTGNGHDKLFCRIKKYIREKTLMRA